MAPAAVATPTILKDPGYLFIAPLASTLPTNTVVGSVFTDAWAAAWIPIGATEDGSTVSFSSSVEPVMVAEFFDAITNLTTERSFNVSFSMADYTATRLRRALNGGIGPLTATSGSTTTALYTVEPPAVGAEVRAMIGWESQDNTVRFVMHQSIQGGDIEQAYAKAPAKTLIPCTFNGEVTSAGKTVTWWAAGSVRGGTI